MQVQEQKLDVRRLHDEAEKNAAPEPRFVRQMDDWQNARQGDLLLIRVPTGALKAEKPHASRQLAPGSSQGSRHTAEAPAQVFAPDGGNAAVLAEAGYDSRVCQPALIGPVIRSAQRFEVAHPEHAHLSLPKGDYCVLHQRDYESEAIQQVRD